MSQEPTIRKFVIANGKTTSVKRLALPNILKLNKRAKRRLVRATLVSGNALILFVVAFFVVSNHSASQTVRRSTVASAVANSASSGNPLDQLSSAEIAVQAAQLAKLDEVIAIRNQADSENALLSFVPSDSTIVTKPQIVMTSQRSKKNIIDYKVVPGDTVTTVATKFGLKPESIKGSNDLFTDKIEAGRTLLIPPADGIAYVVKAGDTLDNVVNKFKVDKVLFVTVNDAESGNLVAGDRVWAPNGVQPVPVPVYFSNYSGINFVGFAPNYGSSNGYAYGYCTWYVANKRAAIGRPVPSNLGNAVSWKALAQRAGIPTGPDPMPGAVAWRVATGYLGHVAFVEEVYPDGSFKISEMNVAGWARVSTQIVPASGKGQYYYIY